MPPRRPTSPYDMQPVDEIQLKNAPLTRVLAQVRHPPLRVLADQQGLEAALRVADRVAQHYPIFEPIRENGILLTPEGPREDASTLLLSWRLRSADQAWQATLSKDFLSLETSKYQGRKDFCDRLSSLLEAYAKEVDPPSVTRVGLRYTNRISSAEELASLGRLVHPELLGPLNAEKPSHVNIPLTFSQAQFTTDNGGSVLNWGLLPAGTTYDVSISPTESASWYLDIDCFENGQEEFDVERLSRTSRALADRAHTHFRWSVTDEFLVTFGGDS